MGLFSKLFSKKETVSPQPQHMNEECRKLLELSELIKTVTTGTHYVARSEYQKKITEYEKVIEYFTVLKDSGMLASFCAQNGLDQRIVFSVLDTFADITAVVDKANDEYINRTMQTEKEYLNHILSEVDPQIMLDDDQRRVVLTDEDYCLVVAGAGAGKTTTVAAKVKYLVEKKGIDPHKMLVVSFTNKAVQELRDKIVRDLNIECNIATFHATGNTILHRNSPEKLNIVDEGKLYFTVLDYFKSSILKNEKMVDNLILFFASYFDAPYEGKDLNQFFNKIAKSNFSTMRSELENFKQEVIDKRTKKTVTILNEQVRSLQEVEIANFLYLNNIDYEYEPIYQYDIQNSKKPYTPDFIIRQGEKVAYVEHFGISEDGKNNIFSEEELARYKKAINDKIMLHRQHGTNLIYTFSQYKDHKPITEHLKEQLIEQGFELSPRSNKEIMEKLVSSEESKYIRKLVLLICRFISNFKVNGYKEDEFARMYHATQNVRTRLFLEICNDCYLEYQRKLKENDAIDFQDMINESARLLREVKEMGEKVDFDYIIVDEYQDISRQRFDLVRALADVTDAKIIAVGDDWQSIYAFSGSDITLFTKFEEKMGYAKMLKIVRTYRNSQEVIDIAGNFIQENKEQITKELISPKTITDPVIIYTYDTTKKDPNGNWRSGVNYAIAAATETALDQIMEYNKKENKKSKKILVLGRFGFDGDHLEKSGLFEFVTRGGKLRSVKYPELDMTFMTAHASKGLGYDEVIVINGRNETYGFPAKIEDDPVLALVIRGDRSIDYAEERRLFYVAMTRTKNRVYFIAPERNPSEFLLELKHNYKNVILKGEWNEEPPTVVGKKTCPMCGYPLQYRFKKAYGLRLHICTNDPEICGFMTNDVRAGKLSIIKCDSCHDGYLVVKPGKTDEYILGCTNYNRNGTGCSRLMSQKYYYEIMNMAAEPIVKVVKEEKRQVSYIEKKKERNVQKIQKPEVKQTQISEEKQPVSLGNIQRKDLKIVYSEHDLFETVYTILQALMHLSETKFYGVYILACVVHGLENDKVKQNKLQTIPEFGSLAWMSMEDITSIINWLISKHYILQTKGNYPVLHPTADTAKFADEMTLMQLVGLKRILTDKNGDGGF